MEVQRTIERPGELRGIGLQSGEEIRVAFKPAPPNTGIIFNVSNNHVDWYSIKASITNLIGVNQSTVLGTEGVVLNTVEHVLSALYGSKIDNLYIDVEGSELPILDGSCCQFVEYFSMLGIRSQPALRKFIKITREIFVGNKDRHIHAYPSDNLCIDYEILFDHPAIQCQRFTLNSDLNAFFTDIAPARTFGFLKEIKVLRKKGYLKGGSLQNAVVVGRRRILNPELRYADEFVRHKVLDALGDLYLLGYPLLGHIKIYRGGHSLHANFVRYLIENPECWVLVNSSNHESAEYAEQSELSELTIEQPIQTISA
ncbi:MAG: UDP-3-O-[3-hydroxymyristoyl] N-acetylglucosamine deacetylase [Candidatus Schekmanbacteria bacterium RBG_13_48_7]|uniref:UDP-3-O-acyl-N-acetylglucosamine deacetylase n=1 Tax=Candidatus Schekmanbacteria bacterium RBG_13_48_7 TaxID=1817878 RepID=A0A1F7RWK3_9BACT|nr:MAG: UDP-3-O-[3-hydroxymyristoyl] N-acetylglucosamine deacetylase [Candidatus Schekmanbacteria bacterium RBG_13_48_7]